MRAAELMAAPGYRDLASIRLGCENNKAIKAAIQVWKELQQLVLVAAAKKSWDEKTVDLRKQALQLLHREIRARLLFIIFFLFYNSY